MESLVIKQNELIKSFVQLESNIKKDSSYRKTAAYFAKKLDTLDQLWEEFQHNHLEICEYKDIKYHQYIVENVYTKTEEHYHSIKTLIISQQQKLLAQPQSQQEKQQESHQSIPSNKGEEYQGKSVSEQRISSRGAYSKCDEMLRKQSANFTAFERTLASINLDSLSDKWEYDDALKSLQSRWATVDSLHWEIYGEQNGENPDYEAAFNQHEQSFIKMKRDINKKLWSVSYRDKSTPQMEIPEFGGQYNQWVSFKDLFNEAIHNNPSLSSAQKMQFLKAKVKGEAERLIQHLTISSTNYQICWEILNNRYNNKKLIFTSHANTLLGFQNMQQQSLGQIKKLHDLTLESLHGIKNLDVDISTWDPIIVHILSQKLDNATYGDYIESLDNSRELPNLNDFLKFLESKFTILESSRRKHDVIQQKPTFPPVNQGITYKKSNYNNNSQGNYYNNTAKPFVKSMPVQAIKCPLCYKDHGIFSCNSFLEMPPEIKLKTINKLQYCINCLYPHNGNPCYSQRRCRNCTGQHNTLLHTACVKMPTGPAAANGSHYNQQRQMNPGNNYRNKHANNTSNVSLGDNTEILLATTMIKVTSIDGTQMVMRALIDQGSQVSLITEKAAQTLGIKRQKCQGLIVGVGAKENNSKGLISITCSSIYEDFTFDTDVIIMNNLIKHLPNQTFQKPAWSYLENIKLADPEFNVSRDIDILFGADIYSMIMLGGIIRGEDQVQPIVQQTRLGWIICGSIGKSFQCNVVLNHVEEIQKFWALEDVTEPSNMTSDDQECVDFYMSTTRRRSDGRYEVKLPMVENFQEKIGSSKQMATAQFLNLEKKFQRELQLSKLYKEFIKEYQKLGHMEPCTSNTTPEYYLPHHSVQRSESLTCKLRVVFNAGNKSSTGYSLNDLMYQGPNLQQDLQSLILKWRQHKYVFTADIEKMFRGIMLQEEDRSLQKIIWRDNPQQPLQSYQLTTVSYGVKASPFLAMMTLRKLAADEREQFQEAASILEENFYTDDLVHGTQTVEHGKQLVSDLNQLLKKGGFTLRKWSSNNPELLSELNNIEQEQTIHHFKTDDRSKILGLGWNAKDDTFSFTCTMSEQIPPKLTKRLLLSEISKIFDPLGWLAPVVVRLKIFFQEVYNLHLNWDDIVPQNIRAEWIKLRSEVDNIRCLKMSRWIGSNGNDNIELHGFCDASEKAYSSVVYTRIIQDDQIKITLIAAKTKLVPKKKEISLPKLELSGALLLSKLLTKVRECLNIPMSSTFGWSDSMVVLGWLQGSPERWKPFVKNRVSAITQVVDSNNWRYVKSAENPADSASRGISAAQLKENTLWFNGPQWLQSRQIDQSPKNYITNHEIKIKQSNVVINEEEGIIEKLIQKHSCINRAIRVIAWLLRALNPRKNLLPSYLTLHELRKANLLVIKQVQRSEFEEDINHLIKHNKLHHKSKLLSLNPVLDENGLLRVGGRLEKSNLDQDMKHPLIIPHSSRVTDLLIDEAHHLTFHGGPRLTLSALRMKYWIIGGNRAVKKRVRSCITCRKQNKEIRPQIMGDLPEARVTPAPPFYHTGVDYTGFIDIKANKGRGVKTTKGYIAIFVCMVTKAVHLELVSDLTSSAFLASLRRMAARRKAPKHMYSDQGKNFIGASRKITEEYVELEKIFDESFYKEISELKIEWHFNAPSWPTAGGLWERAVRSLKYHMKRVIGDQKLTFEELSTILAQLEACLNARPLCALTEDVEDLDALTPAHFLYGDAGLTVIETEQDARTRWHLIGKLHQDIWQRWKTEYLTQLSARGKWLKPHQNIEVGSLVLIQDDIIPAGKWPLGRVIDVHPGADGYVRVVTLKTKNGYIKRPVTRLSILPLHTQNNMEQQDKLPPKISTDKKAQGNKNHQKASNHSSFTAIALALICFLNILCPVSASYNITNIDNRTFYFDSLGKMQILGDEWRLITYYNMTPYWEAITAVNKYSKYIEHTCKQIREQNYCHMILSQLGHDANELQHYNELLLNQHFSRSRTRRGVINVIGNIANSLFGVLDDRFAEQYRQDIEHIQRNQHHLSYLLKNQTSIVEAEFNLLKRTEETIAKQHTIINQHISQLNGITNSIQTEIQGMSRLQDVTLSALAVSNMIQNLRRIQDTLLNTVTDIYHGQINVHLLTPNQLREQLQTISAQLTNDLRLPIDNIQTDFYKMYKLLNIRARMLEDYFIFEITIPLISRENYNLYRIIPLPHQIDELMISIVPVSEYIAINLRKDSYILVSYNELLACRHEDDSYRCHLSSTINHLNSDEQFCETDLTKCKTIKSVCRNKWSQLNNPSNYLYFCCNMYSIRIICEKEVTVHQLSKVGIIALDHTCIAKGRDITIHSQQQKTKTVNIGADVYVPSISINRVLNISTPIEVNLSQSMDPKINGSLTRLGEEIIKMKTLIDNYDSDIISTHDIHQYSIMYVLVSAAVVAAAVFLWRRRRAGGGGRSAPRPPARAEAAARSHLCEMEMTNMCSARKVSLTEKSDESENSVSNKPNLQRSVSERVKGQQNKATSPIIKKHMFSVRD